MRKKAINDYSKNYSQIKWANNSFVNTCFANTKKKIKNSSDGKVNECASCITTRKKEFNGALKFRNE